MSTLKPLLSTHSTRFPAESADDSALCRRTVELLIFSQVDDSFHSVPKHQAPQLASSHTPRGFEWDIFL